jgi:hypothetical protein
LCGAFYSSCSFWSKKFDAVGESDYNVLTFIGNNAEPEE